TSLRNRLVQAKERSTTHRRGRRMKPRLASGSLTTQSSTPCSAAAALGVFPGIALIDEGDFDVRLGRGLNGLGDAADLGAVVGVGGRDMQGQPMPERVDGQMQLRSLL